MTPRSTPVAEGRAHEVEGWGTPPATVSCMARTGAWRGFVRELVHEVREDRVASGAAALAFYLMLSLFPAAIAALSLLPYLPVPHLEQALMDGLHQALPGQAAALFDGTVHTVVAERHGGLLSFGLLFAVWTASNGMRAVVTQLDVAFDVRETRPWWKLRGLALALSAVFFLLVVGAFALVVFGGVLQDWVGGVTGFSPALLTFFAGFRWVVIVAALVLAFSVMYALGPCGGRRFRFASPGALVATATLVAASLGFRAYVGHFAHYDATYGSLGAVIVLLLWLYLAGWALLLGAEVDSLREELSRHGTLARGGLAGRGDGLLRG